MTPLERSAVYRGFAAAFRDPAGGMDILDQDIVPAPPAEAARAFMEAFEPSVSRTAVSLHASAHLPREQTDLYQELIRWYSHFGLKRRDGGALPDHLSVMLDFMQFLTWQEHENASDSDAVARLRRAQKDFLSRLALPAARAVADGTEVETPRYRVLPRALADFLEADLAGA